MLPRCPTAPLDDQGRPPGRPFSCPAHARKPTFRSGTRSQRYGCSQAAEVQAARACRSVRVRAGDADQWPPGAPCAAAGALRGRWCGRWAGCGTRRRQRGQRGVIPLRAQSSPRHACGLFPPVFPQPCTTPEGPPQRRAAALAWGRRSLRIPARKGAFSQPSASLRCDLKMVGGPEKGNVCLGPPGVFRN